MNFGKAKGLFKTRNLDLAAAIVCSGTEVNVRKLGIAHAEFYCKNTSEIEKVVTVFLKGKLEVNIAAYSYARMTLKRLVQHEPIYVPAHKRQEAVAGEFILR